MNWVKLTKYNGEVICINLSLVIKMERFHTNTRLFYSASNWDEVKESPAEIVGPRLVDGV